jgi:hypothetical protein
VTAPSAVPGPYPGFPNETSRRPYKRPETTSAANARFIAHQAQIPIVEHWGGGMVVSVDGLRFVVPVKSLWAGPNPRYFGLRHRGATWLNVVNDQVMGIGGLIVPGTLRDSLFILDAIWLLGTHQGAVSHDQLDYYLDEFTFRFNRRRSHHRGLLFYRLLEGAVTTNPHPYKSLTIESAA